MHHAYIKTASPTLTPLNYNITRLKYRLFTVTSGGIDTQI